MNGTLVTPTQNRGGIAPMVPALVRIGLLSGIPDEDDDDDDDEDDDDDDDDDDDMMMMMTMMMMMMMMSSNMVWLKLTLLCIKKRWI